MDLVSKGELPYQCFFTTKKLSALGTLIDLTNADFPGSTSTSCDLCTQRATYYLMTVAYTYDLDPLLCEDLSGKLNKPYHPWIIIEGIESYIPAVSAI